MIKIKNITDVITNSSSEVFIRKLKKSERMFLKSLRTKNIEEEKVANPDDPEEWYYIDSCGIDLVAINIVITGFKIQMQLL